MSSNLTIRLALCALLAAPSTAQTLVRSLPGWATNSFYGRACVRASDQNGDGYDELLVGAPGYNGNRGAIYCVSGKYLATGAQPETLWSLAPQVGAGDQFGYALAEIGDMSGDGVPDFLIGQPGYDTQFETDCGLIRRLDGATHALVGSIRGEFSNNALGRSIAACGNVAGTALPDVLVGAPGWTNGSSGIYVIDGGSLDFGASINGVAIHLVTTTQPGQQIGASVTGGSDLDGDGLADYAFGQPGFDNGSAVDAGRIHVLSTVHGFVTYASNVAGERLGQSLSMGQDYDGDGVADLVAGAPNFPDSLGGESGRVLVLSGARLVAQTPPYEIYVLPFGTANGFDHHFGAAVCASADLNGDGVGEILAGAPDFMTFSTGGFNVKGHVSVYSGATGVRIGGVSGSTNEHLGDTLAGAIGDLDGDPFSEFALAGSLSDAGGTDSGVVKCYSLFPTSPVIYCSGKANSLGCTPQIASSGSPSSGSGLSFLITAANFLNQKSGLLFYSHQPSAVPFQGGTKCAANPIRRTAAQSSGGSSSGNDCSGTYSFDFNAWIAGGADPSLVTGCEVFAQYWSRDPASASHTSLSNAIRFLVNY